LYLNHLKNIKKEGFKVREKTHLKKNSFRVFAELPEFWVNPTGLLVYFGSITDLDFE
jgi:hypothetical protein